MRTRGCSAISPLKWPPKRSSAWFRTMESAGRSSAVPTAARLRKPWSSILSTSSCTASNGRRARDTQQPDFDFPGSLMHRALFLTPALLVVFLAGCGSQKQDPSQAGMKAPDPIPVRVAKSEARTVERSVPATGSLLADDTVTVSSEVAGRVTRIAVDFGQSVKQ